MIIGACGYGATGSSVLTDLLTEYESVQVFDSFEFVLPYMVDGLQDLEYHLMLSDSKYAGGDYAIKRFKHLLKMYDVPFINKPIKGKEFKRIGKKYIDSITQLQFQGIQTADMNQGSLLRRICAFGSKKVFLKYLDKIRHKPTYLWPSRTLNFSVHPDNFYEETRKFIDELIVAMGANLDLPVCLDQPFSGDNPMQTMKFFNDPKAVVIDRDPRDLYIQGKFTRHPDCKFYPRTNVDDFIIYYRQLRKNKGKNNSESVLEVNFEDFIYEYESTRKKIEVFLELPENKKAYSGFNPEHSKNNTQMFKKYPEEKNAIKKIEKELSPFLYPFEKYPDVDTSGPSFTGAERSFIVEK